MKYTHILLTGIGALLVGIVSTLAFQSMTGPGSISNGSADQAGSVNSAANVAQPDLPVVRGPYPMDPDGCFVIDLSDTPASQHDADAKTYTWLVEHPTEADCVRQTNPTIAETITDSINEKLVGTNIWQMTFTYR